MSQLETVLDKLKGDLIFSKDYEITMEKSFDDDIICVKRPEIPPEEKNIYNPHIGVDYYRNFCFRIDIIIYLFFFSTIRIIPVSYNMNNKNKNNFFKNIGETSYNQDITYNINISAIKKYIENTEWTIIRKRTNEDNYLASNEYQCSKCKCRIIVK